MSKRARAAAGTGADRKTAAAAKVIEVISLLDDSSQSEDDPDDAALQQPQAPPQPAPGAARPSKRLRRMDAVDPPVQQPRTTTASAAATAATTHGGQPAAAAPPATHRRQPADDPPASQRAGPKLRQAALPVASLRPRTTALPLQTLNASRARTGGAAAHTFSGDSMLAGGPGSPAPSASPSLSQRSPRLSQDPDYMPASQSQSHGAAPQPSASQRHNQRRQQPARPQLRQLTFAPARTGAGTTGASAGAAARGSKGLPYHDAADGVDRTAAAGPGPAPGPSGSGRPGLGAACGGPQAAAAAAAAPASCRPACPAAAMWTERHAPACEDDLVQVLHRKKVTEVKDWLEHQRRMISQATAAPPHHHPRPLTQPSFAYGSQQQPFSQLATQQGAGQPRQPPPAWPGGGWV